MTSQPPILVGLDASPGADAALQWAIEDAGTRNVPVRLVCAYRWALDYHRQAMHAVLPILPEIDLAHFERVADSVVKKALERAHEIDATVEVHGEAIAGDPVAVLIEESRRGSLLVLGSRPRSTHGSSRLGSVSAAVTARAECPAIVVAGSTGLAGEERAVVVGVDGTESSDMVLAFAFDFASRHHTPLRALLYWHPDLLASMMWRPEPPAPTRAKVWLSEALAGWQEKYPDVAVHSAVIRDHPAAGLVAEFSSAELVVVGNRSQHALVGTLLGSVSQAVLHHATGPIAVVPTHSH